MTDQPGSGDVHERAGVACACAVNRMLIDANRRSLPCAVAITAILRKRFPPQGNPGDKQTYLDFGERLAYLAANHGGPSMAPETQEWFKELVAEMLSTQLPLTIHPPEPDESKLREACEHYVRHHMKGNENAPVEALRRPFCTDCGCSDGKHGIGCWVPHFQSALATSVAADEPEKREVAGA